MEISRLDSSISPKPIYTRAELPIRFQPKRANWPKIYGGKIVGIDERMKKEKIFLFSFRISYPWDGKEEILDIAVDGEGAREMKPKMGDMVPLPVSEPPKGWRELLRRAEEEARRIALEKTRWWEERAKEKISEDISNLFLYGSGLYTVDLLGKKAEELLDFHKGKMVISWLGLCELLCPKYEIKIDLSSTSGDLRLKISQDLYSGEIRYPICGRCGKSLEREAYIARDDLMLLCVNCSLICPSCDHVVKLDSVKICDLCGRSLCSECLIRCSTCGRDVCSKCRGRCQLCMSPICMECLRYCDFCGKELCPEHLLNCISCGKRVCPDCCFSCSRCGEAICKEDVRSCFVCGQVFCDGCMAICEICGKGVCLFHMNTCPVCKIHICDPCNSTHRHEREG